MTNNSYSYKRGVTGFYQESQNPLCLVVTSIVVYKNTLYINLHTLFIIHIKTSSRIQELLRSIKYIKIYIQNNFMIVFNLFCICNAFEFKATWIFR